MKWVKPGDRVPIKSWCDPVEDGAMAQAVNLSRHSAVFQHVALMPDCHQGYGMPIGGVIACLDAVIPNAVGVDIGCGMIAVRSNFPVAGASELLVKEIIGKIRPLIPVGFNRHGSDQEWDGFDRSPDVEVVQRELKSARKQIGTLGGGNHFIEIQKGSDGFVWAMIHSGSRNFGLQIAKEYNNTAKVLCQRWNTHLPDPELAFLPIGERAAQEYVIAMDFALEFAQANRVQMMERVKEAMSSSMRWRDSFPEPAINIHHNFAVQEDHFGKSVWVHRKGATKADVGQFGIIPGSMGTPSYIVKGLGNPESFKSCSHGAGRRMGRAEASRSLTQEDCDKAMEGIVFGRWGQDRKGNIDLSEAPGAYKDIDAVMEAQQDLVQSVIKLVPLGVIKG